MSQFWNTLGAWVVALAVAGVIASPKTASARLMGELLEWPSNQYGPGSPFCPSPSCEQYQRDAQKPAGNDFVDVSVGWHHSLALRADGSLESWGIDWSGSGGNLVDEPAGNDFVAISAGQNYNLALRANGTLVRWGSPLSGQPTGTFSAIAAGFDCAIAITTAGNLVAWGNSPMNTVPKGTFVSIAAGNGAVAAVRSDGHLFYWSNNPTNVPSDRSGYAAVSLYYDSAIALKQDGTLVQWGWAGPQHPDTGSGNSIIAAGLTHSVSLTSAGFPRVFDYRSHQLPPRANYIDVAAGQTHTLYIRSSYSTADFDHSGQVDAADYTIWRDQLGSAFTGHDYEDWVYNFGFQPPPFDDESLAVPEPTSCLLLALGLMIPLRRRHLTRC